jgi:acetylornithine deacetylase/succinyl-diaminopimelate desuccinylase-like protein
MVRASEKVNVIPAAAELKVDCRVPPGLGADDALRRIHEVLGDPAEEGYEIEFSEEVPGRGSPIDTPLMDAITSWVHSVEPDARAVPIILPGFSDSTTFREAFPDLVAYGFFPQANQSLYEGAPLVHSANERIDVRDLGLATDFFRHACRELLGDAGESGV